MTTNTSNWAVIGFIKDHDEREERERRNYIVQDGGLRNAKPVKIFCGNSIKYFLIEISGRLTVVCKATTKVEIPLEGSGSFING